MRLSTVLVAAVCIALASTAVQASTITYQFAGVLDDGTTPLAGWLEIGTLPTNTSSIPSIGEYQDNLVPFLDWKVTVGSTSYVPSGPFRADQIYVLDFVPDMVLVNSEYDDTFLALLFEAEDGDAFSGVDVPNLAAIDWRKIDFFFTDTVNQERFSGTINVFVVPLPPSALAGLGMLGCLALVRRLRRRK